MKQTIDYEKSENIVFCEADSSYTVIHLISEKKFIKCKTLKVIQGELNDTCFIRVHSKYLVNRNFIKAISTDVQNVIMINGRMIPISRRRKTELKKWFRAVS